MRQWHIVGVAVLVLLIAGGQHPWARQKFTSSTTLLTLDVTVVDRDGNPITGLTADDFSVALNGTQQPVRALTYLGNVPPAAADTTGKTSAARPPSSPFTALDPENGPDPRLFVLMVDDLSIRPGDSKGLMVAAERFLDAIPSRDAVGLTTTSGMTVVNPSHDHAETLKGLKHMVGILDDPRQRQPYVGIFEALQIDAGNNAVFLDVVLRECHIPPGAQVTLQKLLETNPCAEDVQRRAIQTSMQSAANARSQVDAYDAVIKAMAPAPGVKQLVVITGGLTNRVSSSPEYTRLAKSAAAAGVQLTMLMEEPDAFDGKLFADDQRQLLAQAQTLTDMSGGQFFRVIGQAGRFYDRVMRAASAVYRVGVDVPAGSTEKTQFEVSVAVNRAGAQVHASRYASRPVVPVNLSVEERVKRAIATGEPAYAVPVQLTPTVIKSTDGSQTAIRVVIDVPGDIPGPVSGLFALVDEKGHLRSGKRDVPKTPDGQRYHLDFIVPVPDGGYEVRFAVSDASGAVGAIATKIIVHR